MIQPKKVKTLKQKTKHKRQRTFTSSELSLLPEDINNRSLVELFRNEVIKKQGLHPPKKIKSQKQLLSVTKKKGKSKSKSKFDKCESY